MKPTKWEIFIEILADPASWTRIGLAITGIGGAAFPTWWAPISIFGMFICPLVAQVLTEIQRRQKRADVAALVQEKKDAVN